MGQGTQGIGTEHEEKWGWRCPTQDSELRK